jgi:hypothetical protein
MTDTKGASTGHLLFGVGWATTKLVNNAVSFQSHDYIVRTVYTLLLVYYYMAPICKATQHFPARNCRCARRPSPSPTHMRDPYPSRVWRGKFAETHEARAVK